MLVNFMIFSLSADFFSKSTFQEYHRRGVKQFGSRSGPTVPGLGPNFLQRLSADDKIRNKQGKS